MAHGSSEETAFAPEQVRRHRGRGRLLIVIRTGVIHRGALQRWPGDAAVADPRLISFPRPSVRPASCPAVEALPGDRRGTQRTAANAPEIKRPPRHRCARAGCRDTQASTWPPVWLPRSPDGGAVGARGCEIVESGWPRWLGVSAARPARELHVMLGSAVGNRRHRCAHRPGRAAAGRSSRADWVSE